MKKRDKNVSSRVKKGHFPLVHCMTPAQERKAITLLKERLKQDDEAFDDTGYNNHEDTMRLRVFLIEIGAVPDRRAKGKRCSK